MNCFLKKKAEVKKYFFSKWDFLLSEDSIFTASPILFDSD